jgi:predicted ArsR family transcriptional regulator
MLLPVIADARRRAILAAFAARRATALTVDEVAAEQGLHRTVAFNHLERLANASLLVRGARPGDRGRPARTYSYGGQAAEVSHPQRRYRLLADILATSLAANGDGGVAAARDQGRATGQKLASRCTSSGEAIDALAAIGGDYLLDGARVVSRNCLFNEVCGTASDVVCGVNAGIIEGALEAAGTAVDVVPAGPDESGGCSFRLQARQK